MLCGREGLSPAGFARHYDSMKCKKAQLNHQKKMAEPVPLPVVDPAKEDLSALLRRLRQSNKLLRRIPKAARYSVAESLIEVLENCIRRNDVSSWTRLLTFSYGAFSLPDPSEKKKESLASMVKRNLTRTTEPSTLAGKLKQSPTKQAKSKLRNAVERKMQDGDITGAVRILSSDDAVASPTADVFDVLKTIHPTANAEAVYPPEPSISDPILESVTPEEVLQAINSFPNGSAGGLDGLRPQHLKDLVSGSTGEIAIRLTERLASLIDLMLSGNVPLEICPLLYGACVTALKKKDGGIRPIAVGNTLRRLAGKIVSRRVMETMGQLARPTQLGYGTRGGAEAVVHATRAYMSDIDETQVILKLDFRNAFNTVRRDKMLLAVRTYLPKFYSFIWQMYRNPSKLFFGDFLLQSESGVQQGDPLGPLLFCLVTRELTTSMQSPLNCWYLDDGTIGGTAELVESDLRTVMTIGEDIGLELNLSKCEAFVFGGDSISRAAATSDVKRFAKNIRFPKREELSLLGSPLLPEAITKAMDKKTSTIRLLTSRLTDLQAHQALFILKNCLSTPKVLYVLRSSPAWTRKDKLEEFDSMIRSSLASITNTDMTDAVWRQATLPVSKGGLGIRRTEELALPAFLASVHSVRHLISSIAPNADLDDVLLDPMIAWRHETELELPILEWRHSQKQWDTPMVERIYKEILTGAKPTDKARLLAVAPKESGAWLQALPSPSVGNLLDDDTLRISVALRLGALICHPHQCRCGSPVDSSGHHGLSCKRSAGRHSRHSSLNDVVRRALISSSTQAILEPPKLERENGKRPDGMTLVPWKQGKALVWDVTCVDTMAPSHIMGSISEAGKAAEDAEKKKVKKYRNLVEGKFLFSPVAFETFGPWGPATRELISEIGHKVMARTGEKRVLEFLRQRISIEIQRGNAASVLGTHTFTRGFEEMFYVLSVKR